MTLEAPPRAKTGYRVGNGIYQEKPEVPAVSCIEVFVYPGRVDVFERQGDSMTAALVKELDALGLKTFVRTSSPCG